MSSPTPQQPSPFAVQEPPAPQTNGSGNVLIILGILGVIFVVGLLGCAVLLLPAIGAAREAATRMSRANNVKMVAIGIHNYHAAYKQFPNTISANDEGEAFCGWRLGLSAFVEGQSQWETVTQEWSPGVAQRVADQPPIAFQSIKGVPGETNIFAIVGPECVFPSEPNRARRMREVTDGLSSTAIIIELPNRSTNWTSTDDLTADEAYQAITELGEREVAHLMMGDAAVIAVDPSLSKTEFDALVTRSGNDNDAVSMNSY